MLSRQEAGVPQRRTFLTGLAALGAGALFSQYASQLPQGFLASAKKFYYDTAQTSNPAAMSALAKVIPTSQIVFGTDFPYRTAAEHVKGLAECGLFNPKELQAIDRENALTLLPRYRSLRADANSILR